LTLRRPQRNSVVAMSGRVRPLRSRDLVREPTPRRDSPDEGESGKAIYREPPPAHLFLRYFPDAEIEAIARIVAEIAARKEAFIEQWKELYASSFGAHHENSNLLFPETYVPHLRTPGLRLAAGDPDGFAQFAALLGEQLADGGTPFAILVAHLSLLKQSCVRVLARSSGAVGHGLVGTIDKLTACCISAAADSYYRRLIGPQFES